MLLPSDFHTPVNLYLTEQGSPKRLPCDYTRNRNYVQIPDFVCKRDFICKASEIKRLFGDQSYYQGDRHAQYNVGDSPQLLSPTEREEFLTRLKKIVDKYEQSVYFKLE